MTGLLRWLPLGWGVRLAVVLAVLAAAPADALTLNPGAPRLQALIDASLMPTPQVIVTYDPTAASCRVALGCADGTYLGLGAVARGAPGVRKILLHEVGHVYDYAVLTPTTRQQLLSAMPGRTSWTPDTMEWFADSYSACARVPVADMPGRSFTTGTGLTSGRRLVDVCRAIIRAAR